jgi:cysteine-rich repeat protein
MARSKKFLLLAISPLGLSLGGCSPEMSDEVSYRAGETTEAASLYDEVGDVPTAAPGDKSTTTLITNNELSPIQPINPGKFGTCGDGTLTTFTGEECDDGNTTNGDGCSKQCKIEKNSGPTKFPGGVLQPIKPIQPIKPLPPKVPFPLPPGWGKGGDSSPGDPKDYGVLCLEAGEDSPNMSTDPSLTEYPIIDRQWVGVLNNASGYATCADLNVVSALYDVDHLFPAAVASVPRPAVLDRYCLVRATVGVSPLDPVDNTIVSALNDFAIDRPVVGPQSLAFNPSVMSTLNGPMAEAYQTNTGVVVNLDGMISAAGGTPANVRVSLLDTTPSDWVNGLTTAGLPGVRDELTSGHGHGIEAIVRAAVCNGGGTCAREVETELALPGNRNAAGQITRDSVRGGALGTQSDVALAIDRSLRRYLNDSSGASPSVDHLIMSMSFGWDGSLWGELLATQANKSGAINVANDIVNETQVPGPVRSVLASMMTASCQGVMMVAATGNNTEHTCDVGPLLPAAWEQISRPNGNECKISGFVSQSNTFGKYQFDDSDFGLESTEPLVYAVGALDYDFSELNMQRKEAMPRLAGLGFRGVDKDVNGDWTDVQSGTSIGTATVAAAMANAWSTDGGRTAAQVVEAVYGGALDVLDEGIPLQADFVPASIGGATARRVDSCHALNAALPALSIPCALAVDSAALNDGFDDALAALTLSGDVVDVDESTELEGLVPPLLNSTGAGTSTSPLSFGGASSDDCTETSSTGPQGCVLEYVYIDGNGDDPNPNSRLPTTYVTPQPKSSSCPSCEIITGNEDIHLQTSTAIAYAPGGQDVVVTRTGKGRNPPCSPVVIDLGNLSLSDTRTTVINSPSFATDSCLSKAEVDISYTDASGAYVTVNESLRVR